MRHGPPSGETRGEIAGLDIARLVFPGTPPLVWVHLERAGWPDRLELGAEEAGRLADRIRAGRIAERDGLDLPLDLGDAATLEFGWERGEDGGRRFRLRVAFDLGGEDAVTLTEAQAQALAGFLGP